MEARRAETNVSGRFVACVLGSVHDSPIRTSGGVRLIPNIFNSAARFLIFKFMAISCDVNDHLTKIFFMVIGVTPISFNRSQPKNAKFGLIVSDQINERENIETFRQCV